MIGRPLLIYGKNRVLVCTMYSTRCCGLASGIARFSGPSAPHTLKHCIHNPFGREMGLIDGIMIPELSMCETRTISRYGLLSRQGRLYI